MSSEQQTVSDKNKQFWDEKAKTYDEEDWLQRIVKVFTAEYRKRFDWYGVEWAKEGGKDVRMLDFACGPGMASNAFLDHVTHVRGLDVSKGMVDEYNKRAADKGIPQEKMKATAGDLLADDPSTESHISGPEFNGFDIAVISLALHHMEKPGFALQRIVERLRPGGVIVILDWTNKPPVRDGKPVTQGPGMPRGHSHGHGHAHGHAHHHGNNADKKLEAEDTITFHGFSEEDLKPLLEDAGCDEVSYDLTDEPFRFGGRLDGQEREAFIARGRKAA